MQLGFLGARLLVGLPPVLGNVLPQTEAEDEVGEEGGEAGSDDTDDHPSCVVAKHVHVQGGPHEETVVEKRHHPDEDQRPAGG